MNDAKPRTVKIRTIIGKAGSGRSGRKPGLTALALLLGIALAVGACSDVGGTETRDLASPGEAAPETLRRAAPTHEAGAGDTRIDQATDDRKRRDDAIEGNAIEDTEDEPELRDSPPPPVGGGGAVDSEELVELGEFGLLPSLLEALSPGDDCDPSDPFSNCQ